MCTSLPPFLPPPSAISGFLYTGDLLHDQVAVTQFIAPLQADFNPNHTDTGRVLVWSTGECVCVYACACVHVCVCVCACVCDKE